MLKIIINNRILLLALLFFAIAYPSAGLVYFDGLPFLNSVENIYILAVMPIVIILFFKYLNNKFIKIFILGALFLKFILILYPSTGVNVWQYENINSYKNNEYIKSYDTFWNKNQSFTQKKNWNSKKEFPIDWKYISNKWAVGPNQNDLAYRLPIIDQNDLDKINLIYKISFYLKIERNSLFKIAANGCLDSSFNLTETSTTKVTKNFKCNEEILLQSGNYIIKGFLDYRGDNWSLNPQIKHENKDLYESAFEEQVIFNNYNFGIKNNFFFKILKILSVLHLTIIIFLPLLIFFFGLRKNSENIIYFKCSIIFFLIFFFINFYIYKKFNILKIDIYGSSSISLSIIISLLVFLIYKKNLKFNYSFSNYKLLFFTVLAPVVLFFFINKHYSEIYQIHPFGSSDDWDVWEFYARKIVIEKEWLLAGEPIFVFRPAPRYIYAFYHIFFGKSFFVFKIVESWLVIFSAYFLVKILIKLGTNQLISSYSGIIFLTIFFGENIRWLIGRGLGELYALFIIFSYLYISIVSKIKISYKKFFLLSILSTFGVWFREEHLPLYLVLIFSNFNNNAAKSLVTHTNNFFFIILYKTIVKNLKLLSFYWALTILGFSLLFMRNYYVSQNFGIIHVNMSSEFNRIYSIGRMLTGSEVQNVYLPRSYSLFLISGFIISVYTLIGSNISKIKFNFFLPISILMILVTFLLVNNTSYSPRFTLHYLSFTILICAIFFEKIIIKISKNLQKKF